LRGGLCDFILAAVGSATARTGRVARAVGVLLRRRIFNELERAMTALRSFWWLGVAEL
jgi:hypothetical protein